MAINLDSLRHSTATGAPRILIYGPPGFGKTTFANEFPNPVFIQTEDGTPAGLELLTFGHLVTFQQVAEALISLQEGEHDCQTLVVDSLDKLEAIVWAQTCTDNKWETLETPGYGKGYVAADLVWKEFFEMINVLRTKRGMAIVFLAHSTVERFDDPQTTSYSRYDIRLHKRALALFQDEVDAILFLNQDVTLKEEEAGFNKKRIKAVGGGNRWMYTEGRPAFVAKNRYGLPEKFLYQLGKGYATVAPYLPGYQSAPANAARADEPDDSAAEAEADAAAA